MPLRRVAVWPRGGRPDTLKNRPRLKLINAHVAVIHTGKFSTNYYSTVVGKSKDSPPRDPQLLESIQSPRFSLYACCVCLSVSVCRSCTAAPRTPNAHALGFACLHCMPGGTGPACSHMPQSPLDCKTLLSLDYPCSRLAWSELDQHDALRALGKLWTRHKGILGWINRLLCKDVATLYPPNATRAERRGLLNKCTNATESNVPNSSLVREKISSLIVNGKLLSVDDIVYGYETLFELRGLHSAITHRGVGMQQDPTDAIAIADLLWRVRPRLLIELGTSGGGSALYYARIMMAYDPLARVLTMDPANGTTPLVNWNHAAMCVPRPRPPGICRLMLPSFLFSSHSPGRSVIETRLRRQVNLLPALCPGQ